MSLTLSNNLYRNLVAMQLLMFPMFAQAASRLQCDSKQSYCLVVAKRLVIGDQIVFKNTDDEIVARGEVTDMDGNRRKIVITKSYGEISRDDRVLREDDMSTKSGEMKTYQRPSAYAAGGSLGLMPLNIASDATAYSFEGIGQMLLRDELLFTARAQYFMASGIVDTGEQFQESGDYSVSGMGVLAGVGYKVFPKKPVSLRLLLEAGPTYVSMTTSASSYPSNLDGAGNGFGYAARTGVDALFFKFGNIQPMASVGFAVYNKARATSISAGLLMGLK